MAEGAPAPPQRTIDVKATDMLNVTVTKSLILLSYQLLDAFEKAAKLISPPKGRTFPGSSQYLILNNAGISTKVGNTETMIVSNSSSGNLPSLMNLINLGFPV